MRHPSDQEPFREDNTEFYEDGDLAELNRRYEEAGGWDLEPGDEEMALCERLLTEYDSEPLETRNRKAS